MFALQIQNLLSFTRPGGRESALPLPGRRKPGELFAVLDRFEALGDDILHDLWQRAERGPIEAFGDVGDGLDEGGVSSREEFESWCLEEFPFKEQWFRLSAAEYRGPDKIGIVPDGIFPRHCESWFPKAAINLLCGKPAREALPPHIQWLPLEALRFAPPT